MESLNDVLNGLKSGTAKTRQEALSKVRDVFMRDSVLNTFHIDSNGQRKPQLWLPVYQALFTAVLSEREAFLKKNAASAARKRLSDAAYVVRWLTERTIRFLNSKVTKALFDHLLHTMVHRGELLVPVALDYVKALRCIVTHAPHLEQMEAATWLRMVEMGFNIVLSDPLRSNFEGDDEDSPGPTADDSDLFDDNSMNVDSDEGHALPTPGGSRKRARSHSATTTTRPPPAKLTRSYAQSRKLLAVSHEQVEFMSVLASLFRSPTSLLISVDYPYLSRSVLRRLQKFLELYTADSSLIHDYITLLSAILPTLALNRVFEVQKFARSSWDGLLGLWGTKNKRIKEGLVMTMRILFPFIALESDDGYGSTTFDCAVAINKLASLLQSEAESRWGVDGLNIDCLRLQLYVPPVDRTHQGLPFVARTFRSGWNFDENQALSWAILELQADCVGKVRNSLELASCLDSDRGSLQLFQLSEVIHSPSTPLQTYKDGKRARMENPVASLLTSFQRQSAPATRSYNLQILLFVLDRYWPVFHDTLQQQVIQTLLQFVSFDETTVQAWVFLCFAAIAHAEGSRPNPSPSVENRAERSAAWDSIWTNATRRANVPVVCRAACHAAHVLLYHAYGQKPATSRIPLASQKILLEIETLAKDMDVQGPPYPYDSVCIFLAHCLRVASQDRRLYRMQLEEKVLTWLLDTWKTVEMQKKAASLHMVTDIVLLLEIICGLPERCDLVVHIPLPECLISESIKEDVGTQAIRDFLLYARLPEVATPRADLLLNRSFDIKGANEAGRLNQPRARERRITGCLLKSVEQFLATFGEDSGPPTAEGARRALDVAVIALAFETVLVINGIQSNRRLVQCACKLVGAATSLLPDGRWTTAEKVLLSAGLGPLFLMQDEPSDQVSWDVMIQPGTTSGITKRHLSLLNSQCRIQDQQAVSSRKRFLQVLWQTADVQSTFADVANRLRITLRNIVLENTSQPEADETDGFGPIRTATTYQPLAAFEEASSLRFLLETFVAFLTVGPTLQSASGEPTRDKDLVGLIVDCARLNSAMFALIAQSLFDQVRKGTLRISVKDFDEILDELGELLTLDMYKRSDRLRLIVIHVLDSTVDVWTSTSVDKKTLSKVQELNSWLAKAMKIKKIGAWSVRDMMGRFLSRYLDKDPVEIALKETDSDVSVSPRALLPLLGADEDIRVRFRAASVNARLFITACHTQQDSTEIYQSIKHFYTVDTENYEHMLTRMLSLGNIMIISSAVRRGSYWHLLETRIHSPRYTAHMEAILKSVSQSLGIQNLSVLFEAYASQLAYSIRQVDSDILCFPPHLLGYQDRMQCARAIFPVITPIHIWSSGWNIFEGHCKVLSKSVRDGIQECFGDIVAYQIVTFIDANAKVNLDALGPLLSKTVQQEDFQKTFQQNIDGVVASILRTLLDQDFSDNGAMMKALEFIDPQSQMAQCFRSLTRYRRTEGFETHHPNLPAFPTKTLLDAFAWLRSQNLDVDAKGTSYHVIHQIFADIERSPLINEQNRLLNAISLWIALHHNDFDEPSLLYTLIHGATALLGHPDLARASQSILDWSLSMYRRAKNVHPHIPDILVRICHFAHDYASSKSDNTIATMGAELKEWIDAQAVKLSKISTFIQQVKKALPAWPYQSTPQLTQLYESVTSENLSAVIQDPRIASSKFRIVRRLRDHATAGNYDATSFATYDFWRLKESIPSIQHMQDMDVDAFVELLYFSHGHLDSFRCESLNSASILTRHKKLSKDSADASRESIIFSLLAKIQSATSSRSYIAYHTLRLIKSVSPGTLMSTNGPSSDYEVELQYLGAYPRPPRPKIECDIGQLLTKEVYLNSTRDFSVWVAQVTTLLSEVLSTHDAFYAQLPPILESDTEFAEEALPVLVHTVLRLEASTGRSDKPHRSALSKYFTKVLLTNFVSTVCLRSIIDVVLHLRNFPVPRSPIDRTTQDVLSYNKWLDVNLTLLACGAIACGAYTTALLFLELAVDNPQSENVGRTSSEDILYEIYGHIDEPDGFYGIHDANLQQNLIRRFHHEKQWERAFRFHGAALEAGDSQHGHAEGLIQSFHSFGFDHLANDALRGNVIPTEDKQLSATSYRLAWRTETWDLPDSNEQSTAASLYLALRAIHRERDSRTVDLITRDGLNQGMDRLRTVGSESFTEINEVIQDLMCLHEIAKWRRDPIRSDLSKKEISVDTWSSFLTIDPDFHFSNLENIMATRISLVRSARQKEERQQIGTLVTPFTQTLIDVEKQCLILLARAARTAGHAQVALNSITRAQRLEKTPSYRVFEEFSNVLWSHGEEQSAIDYLDKLRLDDGRKYMEDTIPASEKALLLARLGSWSSQACLKKPTDIQLEYFSPATETLQSTPASGPESQRSHGAVYRDYAIFAQRQYQAIVKSPDVVRWKLYIDRKQEEIQARGQDLLRIQNPASTESRDLKKNQARAHKLLEEDSKLYRTHITAQDAFLKQSIDMYSRCLEISDSFDVDASIRLCSLWFSNFENGQDDFQAEIRVALERVPSRKFIFLAHQLSARISTPATGQLPRCQANLQDLVLRMCQEHPFHSLYQVYCLQPTRPAMSFSSRRHSGRFTPPIQSERSAAAGAIFDRLRSDPTSGGRVRDIENLCDMFLQWAKYPIQREQKYKQPRPHQIPDGVKIREIFDLRVPVVTQHTPIDPTMRYDNCVWIDHYEKTFTTAGGINLPKIVTCIGSNSLKYKQLFKGEGDDDLRQDAVMEQVFDLVNHVLHCDLETKRRLLSVRDYRVIPLGSQAGLLEFVGNTVPMKTWLESAHARYHPEDIGVKESHKEIIKLHAEHKHDLNKLVSAFEDLMKRLRPVLRHYFTEKHKTPMAWFAMRLNYTRSVATTSIVGHILGLGDRHTTNILLDNVSGQVVHIDLGIAFEQGKLLPVPETVPFRMTRDIVDGMGMSGTAGVFQRCAEETLRVLRADSEVILTVLEVFKYDPLHSWTASEVKVKRVQQVTSTPATNRPATGIGIDMSSGTAEEAADRALSTVARKLDKALSVQYTVNQLVRDATDVRNLAEIFHGWNALL